MSKEKFTKGPWRYESATGEVYGSSDDILVCDVFPDGSINYERNAALIAAAPEMYEMLKTACGMFSGTEFASRAESLLAKARGE